METKCTGSQWDQEVRPAQNFLLLNDGTYTTCSNNINVMLHPFFFFFFFFFVNTNKHFATNDHSFLSESMEPLPSAPDYTVPWFETCPGEPDVKTGVRPSLVTLTGGNVLSKKGMYI